MRSAAPPGLIGSLQGPRRHGNSPAGIVQFVQSAYRRKFRGIQTGPRQFELRRKRSVSDSPGSIPDRHEPNPGSSSPGRRLVSLAQAPARPWGEELIGVEHRS
jgi:hypothetical protein